MTDEERAHCLVEAAWLRAILRLAPVPILVAVAAGLTFGAHMVLTPGTPVLLILTVLMLLPERYLAIRISLDSQLFTALAEGRMPSLRHLDEGLAAAGLRTRPQSSRPLAARLRGTHRLAHCYIALVLAQLLLLTTTLLIG